MSDDPPKLVPIDAEADDQIVPLFRLGETDRAAYQALDPRPQIDVLALDFLRVFLPNRVLLSVQMTVVGPPAIRGIARDAKRLSPGCELHKDGVLASSTHIGQHLARVMIHRVPQPAWMHLAGDKTPQFVEL